MQIVEHVEHLKDVEYLKDVEHLKYVVVAHLKDVEYLKYVEHLKDVVVAHLKDVEHFLLSELFLTLLNKKLSARVQFFDNFLTGSTETQPNMDLFNKSILSPPSQNSSLPQDMSFGAAQIISISAYTPLFGLSLFLNLRVLTKLWRTKQRNGLSRLNQLLMHLVLADLSVRRFSSFIHKTGTTSLWRGRIFCYDTKITP